MERRRVMTCIWFRSRGIWPAMTGTALALPEHHDASMGVARAAGVPGAGYRHVDSTTVTL